MDGRGPRRDLGRRGEETAGAYLRRQGLRMMAVNYRCRLGEIDLVAADGETVVFVEVKARSGSGLGTAEEKITASKKRRLTLLARFFLLERGWLHRPARFDVVTVSWKTGEAVIRHYRNAFDACGPW